MDPFVSLPSAQSLDLDLPHRDKVHDHLVKIHKVQTLAARVKAIIDLREFIITHDISQTLLEKINLFLSFCFNQFNTDLQPAIESFLKDFAAGSNRVTPLHPDLPKAKALKSGMHNLKKR